jgi:hypothetical protein
MLVFANKRGKSMGSIHPFNLRLKSSISGIFRADIYSFVWRVPDIKGW